MIRDIYDGVIFKMDVWCRVVFEMVVHHARHVSTNILLNIDKKEFVLRPPPHTLNIKYMLAK